MRIQFMAIVSALTVLSACTAYEPKPTQLPDMIPAGPVSLSDVTWRLVEFQSMDDAQGIARPSDPSRYTMKLGTDGTASFRFDCNGGTGTYTSTRAADGLSGTIAFSPVTTTLMACPPPSMGEKLAADTRLMTGWMLKDGKLNVSLVADGGIYVWEPAS